MEIKINTKLTLTKQMIETLIDEGMTQKDIANRLHTTATNVRNHMHLVDNAHKVIMKQNGKKKRDNWTNNDRTCNGPQRNLFEHRTRYERE